MYVIRCVVHCARRAARSLSLRPAEVALAVEDRLTTVLLELCGAVWVEEITATPALVAGQRGFTLSLRLAGPTQRAELLPTPEEESPLILEEHISLALLRLFHSVWVAHLELGLLSPIGAPTPRRLP